MDVWENNRCPVCGYTSKNAYWVGTVKINNRMAPIEGFVKFNRDKSYSLDKLINKIEKKHNTEINEFNGIAHCLWCNAYL